MNTTKWFLYSSHVTIVLITTSPQPVPFLQKVAVSVASAASYMRTLLITASTIPNSSLLLNQLMLCQLPPGKARRHLCPITMSLPPLLALLSGHFYSFLLALVSMVVEFLPFFFGAYDILFQKVYVLELKGVSSKPSENRIVALIFCFKLETSN